MTDEIRSTIRLFHQIENATPAGGRDLWLAKCTLFEKNSYRLPASSRNDLLIGFRVLFRTLKRYRFEPQEITVAHNSEATVLGGTVAHRETILKYISASSGISALSFVPRDIMGLRYGLRPSGLIAFLVFALPIAIKTIFQKRRDNYALTISSVAEIALILSFLKSVKCSYAFDFYSFESDSNFMYLALSAQSIRVCKIPSSGPLASHYLKTLCDDLVISTPYQQEEITALGRDMVFTRILHWPPERAHTYYSKFCVGKVQLPANVIGFYSHGQWLRNLAGHAGYGVGVEEDEIKILSFIKNYCDHRPLVAVKIFPHPRELKDEVLEKTQRFYDQHLGKGNYELMLSEGGSAQHFDRVNVAIASYSTIIYERLYCGMKILISKNSKPGFPIPSSVLNNICFSEEKEFDTKLERALHQSEEEFFSGNQLEPFRWNNFPSPLQ